MDGPPLNVVTIGDGDLSFSLALARCTRNTRVVATTYSAAADVQAFYRNAAAIIQVIFILARGKRPTLPQAAAALMRIAWRVSSASDACTVVCDTTLHRSWRGAGRPWRMGWTPRSWTHGRMAARGDTRRTWWCSTTLASATTRCWRCARKQSSGPLGFFASASVSSRLHAGDSQGARVPSVCLKLRRGGGSRNLECAPSAHGKHTACNRRHRRRVCVQHAPSQPWALAIHHPHRTATRGITTRATTRCSAISSTRSSSC